MWNLEDLRARIAPIDRSIVQRTQHKLDLKTKPRRSLGRLEDLACQYAAITGTDTPQLPKKAMVVMGADHGVARRGVSAYPQEVTAQMLLNFAAGGAAINVLARHADAQVLVVDMGVATPVSAPNVIDARVAAGTNDFTAGPAMTREQAERALQTGVELAGRLHRDGVNVIGLGEMGIGNTTSASALTAVLTQSAVEEVTGFGTGIDEATRSRKIQMIRDALTRHALLGRQSNETSAIDVLAALGGFEIAGLAGVVLGAAAHRMAVVLDGFIASVGALVAVRLVPAAREYLLPSHRSVEAGHGLVLRALEVLPVLELDMRLGEGTGAALSMTLLDAALRILAEMATFEAASVTDTGA
ncbi:MAG TPA: nicotinate-nucleotide--dimethylbenzimidazole phosphoribosyltransferase [Polyangiales bacterium]|nr:nicotinate-nucleotide--dimethylbenzimidazole phosphoribosyltransferase [Polyangiales bacterium]